MTDLAEFLLARIAEDEEWAQLSAGPDYSDGEPGTPGHSARVLSECEAKRRIVELHQVIAARRDGIPAYGWSGKLERLFADESLDAYTDVLRLLALPYADHPDYREEWRP